MSPPNPRSRPLTYAGKTMLTAYWAKEYGINHATLRNRLARGWKLERALKQPPESRFSPAYALAHGLI